MILMTTRNEIHIVSNDSTSKLNKLEDFPVYNQFRKLFTYDDNKHRQKIINVLFKEETNDIANLKYPKMSNYNQSKKNWLGIDRFITTKVKRIGFMTLVNTNYCHKEEYLNSLYKGINNLKFSKISKFSQ
jgi:hypothetical protein